MIFKVRWKNYRSIGIFCIVFLLFLVSFIVRNILWNIKKQKITEEWIDISDFPTTLEIDKEWKLLSYPEVTILSETDWELVSLNVNEWDIVEERDILMQIWNEEDSEETIDKLDRQIWRKYAEFYENMDQYNEFQIQYWQEISDLEKELFDDNAALQIATDTNDTKTTNKMKNEIQELQIGNVYKLETEIIPEDATYKELKYESLDASIIEIDNDGNIIANKIGKTTINIKDYKEKVLKTFV